MVGECQADAKIGIIDSFWGSLEDKIGKATKKLGMFGDVIKDVLTSLMKLITSRLFAPIQTNSSSSGGFSFGNIVSGIFGGGSATPSFVAGSGSSSRSAVNFFNSLSGGNSNSGFSSLLGGGASANFGTASPATFGGSVSRPTTDFFKNLGGGQITQFIDNANKAVVAENRQNLENAGGRARVVEGQPVRDITDSVISSGLSWKNIKSSFASLAPSLLMGLGGGLGGSSTAGSIMGSVGGLIGGTLLSGLITAGGSIGAAGSAGILGSIGGFLGLSGAATFGIGAAVAGVMMLGSWLLGRNKQRRADETTRNQLSLDSFAQIDELIKQVQQDKIDGQSAIAQANSVRQQYLQTANGLKDSKTRRIAVADVSRVDARITQLKQAADAQDARKNIAEKWIPVYASGTYLDSSQYAEFKRRNGLLPGAWTGRDYLPSLLADAEMVLNPSQQDRIKRNAGFDVFAGAGIPNYRAKTEMPRFADGVSLTPLSPTVSNSNNRDGDIIINLQAEFDGEKMFIKAAKSNTGKKVIFKAVKDVIGGKD